MGVQKNFRRRSIFEEVSNLVFHFAGEDFFALSAVTDLRSPLEVKFAEG